MTCTGLSPFQALIDKCTEDIGEPPLDDNPGDLLMIVTETRKMLIQHKQNDAEMVDVILTAMVLKQSLDFWIGLWETKLTGFGGTKQ